MEDTDIPILVREVLMWHLGNSILEDTERARKFKNRIFVRTSGGLLQQRYADRVDAAMVTGRDEASAVGT